jgi:hypothetical protein
MSGNDKVVKADVNNSYVPKVVDLGDRVIIFSGATFVGKVNCGTKEMYDFFTSELAKPREYEINLGSTVIEISGKKYWGKVILKDHEDEQGRKVYAKDVNAQIQEMLTKLKRYNDRLMSPNSGFKRQLRTIEKPGDDVQTISADNVGEIQPHITAIMERNLAEFPQLTGND